MAFKMRSGNTTSFKSMGSSPAKQASTKTKKFYVDNYEKNKDKPGFKEAMNKAFGGETKMDGKTSITTTTTNTEKPLKQKGPVDEKNPDLFEGEMEGTWVYEGSDLQERIIDLEDRIEFTQSDLEDAEGEKEKKKYKSTLKKLEQELGILLRERKQKE